MPTATHSEASIPLALQRLFHDMKVEREPVDTQSLLSAFGWGPLEQFMQHDTQEFRTVGTGCSLECPTLLSTGAL